MATRTLREKGHVAYHPKETFMLSVDWVVRNHDVAESMLRDGLQGCAKATRRDTPCVPLYFFRIAYEQSAAVALEESIKTMGEHPHYTKVFKSLEMGMPIESVQTKLAVSGIN